MNHTNPAQQRAFIARLRAEAQQAGQSAPTDLAERIVATLPCRRVLTWPRLGLATAIAAALVTGVLWIRTVPDTPMATVPVAHAPTTPLPAFVIDPSAMPDVFTEPEHPLSGELAALRRDGQRLVDFFSVVGEPLRSAANLAADKSLSQ